MRVYQEVLSTSYLLILTDSDSPAGYTPLAQALHMALCSSKRRVWVDCSNVASLDATALHLLTQGADYMRQRGGLLVLCHPPLSFSKQWGQLATATPLCVAASLLDAEMVND